MTYIPRKRRKELAKKKSRIVTANDLTYVFTVEALESKQIKTRLRAVVDRFISHEARYDEHCMIVGCLMVAACNLDRRNTSLRHAAARLREYAAWYSAIELSPLEDEQLAKNGDVV